MPFITPTTTPTTSVRRCLCIPDEPFWLAAVSGALQVLTHAYSWEDIDGITAEEAADTALEMLLQFYEGNCNMIGQLISFVSIAAMPSWVLPMDGSTYAQADYPALFDVLPASWISGTNFTLPDMVNKTIIGNDFANPTSAPLQGSTGGEATHLLTVAEIPFHNHGPLSGGQFLKTGTGGTLTQGGGNFNFTSVLTTNNAGGNGSHNNMPPYLVVAWGIVAN